MNEIETKPKGILARLFSFLNSLRKVIVNVVFFAVLLLFIVAINSEEEPLVVPKSAALVLNINGDIVEQKYEIDPINTFLTEALDQKPERVEVLLSDVEDAINHAKTDDRIGLLVLKLQGMQRSGLTKLNIIAQALEDFKSSGKKVIAIGDQYSQNQYYLASFADEIWMNPNGWLLLDGYGRYQLYFKSAIEKLEISQHIFRVGTYKSAVEPYMRDSMSEAAKEANQAWLNELWQQYKQDVATQRNFDISNFDETTTDIVSKLEATGGDVALYALNNGWVDELKTREQVKSSLIKEVGKSKDGHTFSHIGFKDYLRTVKPPIPMPKTPGDKVAIVVAKGTILNGTQKPGTIGGDSTAKLLRKARNDDQVKAVVLRVDSPGGSAYASEIIRQEIELLKEAGKPVVASMGTYAASGGYWISASANEIYAAPTTITGSIGIFGMFMTFENMLSNLGIHTDGVGTTEMAGFGITRPLSDGLANIIQMSINKGYKDFLTLVAENRDMSLEQADNVAQGRVWTGRKAKELGLVDKLGHINDAVKGAAELAGLEQYDTWLIEKELSSADAFVKQLFGTASSYFPESEVVTTGPVQSLLFKLKQELNHLDQYNDPRGIYSLCLTCEIN